jgi:hypothetical protein
MMGLSVIEHRARDELTRGQSPLEHFTDLCGKRLRPGAVQSLAGLDGPVD